MAHARVWARARSTCGFSRAGRAEAEGRSPNASVGSVRRRPHGYRCATVADNVVPPCRPAIPSPAGANVRAEPAPTRPEQLISRSMADQSGARVVMPTGRWVAVRSGCVPWRPVGTGAVRFAPGYVALQLYAAVKTRPDGPVRWDWLWWRWVSQGAGGRRSLEGVVRARRGPFACGHGCGRVRVGGGSVGGGQQVRDLVIEEVPP
jgi:hypothetical protein